MRTVLAADLPVFIGPCICQVYGLPDHGVTSSMLELVADYLRTDKESTAAYIYCSSGTFNPYAIKSPAKDISDKLLIIPVSYEDQADLLQAIGYIKEYVDYIILDDIARACLNHSRKYIESLVSDLRKISDTNEISIFILNQMRYQVGKTTAASPSDLKPLYYEYFKPYMDYDIEVKSFGYSTTVSVTNKYNQYEGLGPLDFLISLLGESENASRSSPATF